MSGFLWAALEELQNLLSALEYPLGEEPAASRCCEPGPAAWHFGQLCVESAGRVQAKSSAFVFRG